MAPGQNCRPRRFSGPRRPTTPPPVAHARRRRHDRPSRAAKTPRRSHQAGRGRRRLKRRETQPAVSARPKALKGTTAKPARRRARASASPPFFFVPPGEREAGPTSRSRPCGLGMTSTQTATPRDSHMAAKFPCRAVRAARRNAPRRIVTVIGRSIRGPRLVDISGHGDPALRPWSPRRPTWPRCRHPPCRAAGGPMTRQPHAQPRPPGRSSFEAVEQDRVGRHLAQTSGAWAWRRAPSQP